MRKAKENTAKFVIEIRYKQHSSWQGIVKWLDSEEEICFRSTLELIRILDSVQKAITVETVEDVEEMNTGMLTLLG